jgi:predicted Ser/Thr protein kinase
MARPMPQSIPEKFGRYAIEEELGRGTMGVVYRAFDPVLGRAIALKTIHVAHTLSKRRRVAFEQRFLTEARVAAKLQHPGIVVVHDLGRDSESGDLFIALELLTGENLDDWIEEDRRPGWREALRIVARVAEALHHAHVRGVVHRDVKPANIMVLESGQPKIMDFGIAKIDAGQLTTPGELFGTPLYMSPEQALGQPAGPRSDLFSLGSVAYALLTGRVPFRAPDVPSILARVAHLDPGWPSEAVPALPSDVDYVVARAMAKDPERRYPDGQAMAEDIDDVRAGQPPRHCGGWQMPERGGETVVSRGALHPPEPAQQTAHDHPARSRRRPARLRVFLWFCLAAALTALAQDRDPGLKAFRTSVAPWLRVGRFAPTLPIGAAESWPLPSATATPYATPAPPSPTWSPQEIPSPFASPLAVITLTPASTPELTRTPAAAPEPTPSPSPRATPSPIPTLAPTAHATPRSTPASPSKAASTSTAALHIDVETRVRRGSLRVWIDDRLALSERLGGRAMPAAVKVIPGSHEVRVQLRVGTSVDSAGVTAAFAARQSRRLGARLVKGKLSLRWK